MMISTKGRYALRVMMDIAANSAGEYVTLKDISARQGISVKYLERVVALLGRAGLVGGLRGTGGGYKLKKPASEYKAGDILRAAEGSLAPIACLQDEPNQCVRSDKCTALPFWQGYYRVITEYVDGITLQDLIDRAESVYGDDH